MVDAHDQRETIHLLRHYPEHQPRSDDPNYLLFEEAKRRIKANGQWHCVISNADCAGQTELHHSHFEFAYLNAIDVGSADKLLGLDLSADDFARWVESPGNLEPLCKAHHTGMVGIHLIPDADWDTVRAHKTGITPIEVSS